MPGVSADALHQLMTDVRALFGWQHFITLPLFSAPLHTPVCLADTAPILTTLSPWPPAPPIHLHTNIPASISQALLHQTTIMLTTKGSHANAPRSIQ